MKTSLIAALMFCLAFTANAAELRTPDPGLEPLEVVEIQLSALQANDPSTGNVGIAQAWQFAHPNNKRLTGPLPRFERMIEAGPYSTLLNHSTHEIREIARRGDQIVFGVIIATSQGGIFGCRWIVEPLEAGENAGAWMTVSVTVPMELGEGI